MDFPIVFSQPLGLLLLLLVPLTILIGRRSLAYLPRSRRAASMVVRIALLVLIALSLSGLQLALTTDKLAVVFLLDRSDSIGPAEQKVAFDLARSSIAAMGDQDAAAVVAFGDEALVDRPLGNSRVLNEVASKPASTFSNLADAIRLGLALFPEDSQKRLVLLSDGNENIDSAETAARLAAARGVVLDVVPLPVEPGREVLIEALDSPGSTREGERFNLSVTIRASTDTSATLRLLADGLVVTEQAVNLSRGLNTFVQPVLASGKGFHTYSAEILPIPGDDTRSENNHYSSYSFVSGKPRALLVEGHDGEAASLQAALAAGGMDADVTPPGSMPLDPRALAVYEAVLLVNVPLNTLPSGAQESLQTMVRDLGRGLVVVGGEESYGVGGYFRSTLEEMLPVSMDLPSKLEIPTVGMVLVIDRSGSMESQHGSSDTNSGGGNPTVSKLALAKAAAYEAVNQLSDRDQIGVVAFDDGANWIVPLQQVGDPAAVGDKINTINIGGGTDIYAGLEPAVTELERSSARGKHIILLTDGQSQGGDYKGLLERMKAANITLSTVAIGDGADTGLLQTLADGGGGRAYITDDANTLPQIFAHESHLAARSYIIEHPFLPKRTAPSPILQNVAETPQLLGYVGTTPKPNSTTALVSDSGDPILSHWQYGLGRVVAWTSDAKGRWATQWLGWQGFPNFWGAAVRWSMGAETGSALQPRVDLEGAEARISLDAVAANGDYQNDLSVAGAIVSPSLVSSTVTLEQTAPGHYEATFPVREEGAYLVRVASTNSTGQAAGQTIGLVVPYSPEYRALPADTGLLARLAGSASGRQLALDASSTPAVIFEHNLAPVRNAIDLWPWTLLAVILLLPLDIGLRRVAIGLGDFRRFWGEVTGRMQPAPVPAIPSDAAALSSMERMMNSRRRAIERTDRPPAAEIVARLDRESRPPEAGSISGSRVAPPGTPPSQPVQPPAATPNLAGRVLQMRNQQQDGEKKDE